MTEHTIAVVNLIASALAAAATVVLAVVARGQWKIMRDSNAANDRQNQLMRERWKREDEEKRPKAIFWLQRVPQMRAIELWCANIGVVSFLVAGIRTDPVIGESQKFAFTPKQFFIVAAGQMNHLRLSSPEVLFGSDRPGNCEIKLILEGASGKTESDQTVAYHLWFYNGDWMIKDPYTGFKGYITVHCPKCKAPSANFDTSQMTSRDDCIRQIEKSEEELRQSCPEHFSANERILKPGSLPKHAYSIV